METEKKAQFNITTAVNSFCGKKVAFFFFLSGLYGKGLLGKNIIKYKKQRL